MNSLPVYLFCILSVLVTATRGLQCGGYFPTPCPEGTHCDCVFAGEECYCHKDGETNHYCGAEGMKCPDGYHCEYERGRTTGQCQPLSQRPTGPSSK